MRGDYEGFPTVLASGRTDALPGTKEKIDVMTERFSRRESLFHPDDPSIIQVAPVLMAICQFHHQSACNYRAAEGPACVDMPLPPTRMDGHTYAGPPRRRSLAILGRCLQCNCPDEIASRGLCRPCYQSSLASIRNGKTTWRKLEKLGEASRPTRKQRRRRGKGAA